MRHWRTMLLLTAGGAAISVGVARADIARPFPDTCAPAIAAAESRFQLPAKLLAAIAIVESGRADPVTGRTIPWPWTINVAGTGHVYATKADAVAAVRGLQHLGVRSIDVGCVQINLMHHPDAFASLEEAFDPAANTIYGAGFLVSLYRQFGLWPRAAAAYHSQTLEIGAAYERRVMAIWPLAARFPDPGLGARAAAAVPAIDVSRYTPEFAARVKQMRADRALLAARFGALVGRPADPPAGRLRVAGAE